MSISHKKESHLQFFQFIFALALFLYYGYFISIPNLFVSQDYSFILYR